MLEYDKIDVLSIQQIYQKNAIFFTIGILKILVLHMNLIFVMDAVI